MDALSEILRTARLSSGVFLRGMFSEPWCVMSTLNASDCSTHLEASDHLILFHFVLEGELTIELMDGSKHRFGPGQAAILPRNDPHRLIGTKAATQVLAQDVLRIPRPGEMMEIIHGGGGTDTRIICGFLGGRGISSDPLLNALPPCFCFDSAIAPSGSLVVATLNTAAKEVQDDRAGAGALLARIAELLFVEAVRHYVEELPDTAEGWLGALRDQSVSKALALMYQAPHKAWTANALGREAGASRSTLNAKFVRYLGLPPREFLTALRMQLAARYIHQGQTTMAVVADAVGYGSEAAFSRAFKRHFGTPPSAWKG